MNPFAFQWYVSVKRFDLIGKQKVNPIIRPGIFELMGGVIGSNLPARVHARTSSGHR